jgi:hypothetical protein
VIKAAANVYAVADVLCEKPEVAYHAKIIKLQVDTVNTALDASTEDIKEAGCDINKDLLRIDPVAAFNLAKENADKDKKEIEESRDWGMFSWLKSGVFWSLVGVAALTILKTVLIGTKWGAPIALLIDSLINKIPIVGTAIKTGQAAIATAQSSMAGRFGLQLLDQYLGDKYKDEISKFTNGKCITVEELFKYVAKTYATDSESIDSTVVANFVDKLKDEMVTVGGIPEGVLDLLNMEKAKS